MLRTALITLAVAAAPAAYGEACLTDEMSVGCHVVLTVLPQLEAIGFNALDGASLAKVSSNFAISSVADEQSDTAAQRPSANWTFQIAVARASSEPNPDQLAELRASSEAKLREIACIKFRHGFVSMSRGERQFIDAGGAVGYQIQLLGFGEQPTSALSMPVPYILANVTINSCEDL